MNPQQIFLKFIFSKKTKKSKMLDGKRADPRKFFIRISSSENSLLFSFSSSCSVSSSSSSLVLISACMLISISAGSYSGLETISPSSVSGARWILDFILPKLVTLFQSSCSTSDFSVRRLLLLATCNSSLPT